MTANTETAAGEAEPGRWQFNNAALFIGELAHGCIDQRSLSTLNPASTEMGDSLGI